MTTSGETVLYIGAEEHHIGPYPADQVDKAWSSGILSTTESSAHAFFLSRFNKIYEANETTKDTFKNRSSKDYKVWYTNIGDANAKVGNAN